MTSGSSRTPQHGPLHRSEPSPRTSVQPLSQQRVEGLTGRVVAVTGAAGGLGLAAARALLQCGATVVANHRSPSPALTELEQSYGQRLVTVQGDIAEEEVAIRVSEAATGLGRYDALINCAGITRDRLLVQMSLEEWEEVFRTNVRGAFLATKYAVRAMVRSRYGRIIYISSVAATMGNSGQANYAASKAALDGLARAVSQEYGANGVRTVVVALGLVATGMGIRLEEPTRSEKVGRALLGLGDTTAVADTLAFLSSPAADFINAETIRIDGGLKY